MGEQTVIDHWSSVKDIIDKICIHYDNLWKKRQRALNSKMIVMLILKIVLGDRRQGLSTNLTEFWDTCLEKGISLPQEKPVSASSFCEARQKLSEDIFENLISLEYLDISKNNIDNLNSINFKVLELT